MGGQSNEDSWKKVGKAKSDLIRERRTMNSLLNNLMAYLSGAKPIRATKSPGTAGHRSWLITQTGFTSIEHSFFNDHFLTSLIVFIQNILFSIYPLIATVSKRTLIFNPPWYNRGAVASPEASHFLRGGCKPIVGFPDGDSAGQLSSDDIKWWRTSQLLFWQR